MTVSDRQTTTTRQPTMSTKTLGYVPCWKTGQRAYYRTVKPDDVESIVVEATSLPLRATQPSRSPGRSSPIRHPLGTVGHFFWPTLL
jgi:hypothetical protein